MIKYIIKRLFQAIPILIVVSIISFTIIHMAPGDPVMSYVTPKMSQTDIQNVRKNLGLDKPVPIQYVEWLKNTVKGNLGYSLIDYRPVAQEIKERLPATFLLMGTSLMLALILGISIGLISALYQNSKFDKIFSIISYIGISIPSFWFAMILIIIFAVQLNILPSIGMHSPGNSSILDVIKHLIMPALVLSFGSFSTISRYIRGKAIVEKNREYVRTAKAKGLSNKIIFYKHILRNILLPVVTILGMSLPDLVTGAFITETVFGWPGMGRMGVNAIFSFDYPVIMAITMISSLLLIIGNLISDLLYGLVDPRIKELD